MGDSGKILGWGDEVSLTWSGGEGWSGVGEGMWARDADEGEGRDALEGLTELSSWPGTRVLVVIFLATRNNAFDMLTGRVEVYEGEEFWATMRGDAKWDEVGFTTSSSEYLDVFLWPNNALLTKCRDPSLWVLFTCNSKSVSTTPTESSTVSELPSPAAVVCKIKYIHTINAHLLE